MIEIKKTFSPDGLLRLDYLAGVAFSRESAAHRFIISGPAAFEGTVTASFMRADGQCVIVAGSLDEDGRAVVTADEDCYLIPGRLLITVYLTGEDSKICIYAGLATVYDDRGSGEAASGETTRTIEEMLEELLEGIDNAQGLLEDAADLLDDITDEGATQVAAVQAKGDEVIASIPSDYSTLSGDVGALKSHFTGEPTVIDIYNSGYYVDADGLVKMGSNYSVSKMFDVVPGDTVKLTNVYLDETHTVCGYTADSIDSSSANDFTCTALLSNYEGTTKHTEIEFTVPERVYRIRATAKKLENITATITHNLSSYVSKYQGEDKSGKYLGIDQYGKVVPMNFERDETPLETIIKDGGFTKIFERMGVVGDSLSSGSPGLPDGGGEIVPGSFMWYSWLQYAARYCGNTAYNFSMGGLSAHSLRFGQSNTDVARIYADLIGDDKKCQCYFIALGHNDYSYAGQHSEYVIGTTADIDFSNKGNNADSYIGNIAWVIQTIQEVQPRAKIFILTMKHPQFADFNTALKLLPDLFNVVGELTKVFCLEMDVYAPTIQSSWEYSDGHGNAMGYLNYSWQVTSYVDWVIRHNRSDFKYVQLTETNVGPD